MAGGLRPFAASSLPDLVKSDTALGVREDHRLLRLRIRA
jgi:hypothetical protein